jgi:phosphoserine phosphatase
MSDDVAISQYDASPDDALAAIRTYEGLVIVDLDETLYLRNSTEDFIDCAWPRALALLLLRVLEMLKPWRLTGGIDTGDTWRICAILSVFPWTRWRWRARVRSFAQHYVNRELKAALQARAEPPVILTAGFESFVAPLLAAMGFADAPLIAARTYSFADRRYGKLHMATRELGAETVGSSLVVTDSVNDLALLQTCARPLRTLWPQARYRRALAGVYLPASTSPTSSARESSMSFAQYSRRWAHVCCRNGRLSRSTARAA